MPVIIAIIGLLVAVLISYDRTKRARGVAGESEHAADDVHPIDAIEDSWIATVGISVAAVQMDGLWNESMYNAVLEKSQTVLGMDLDEAQGVVSLSRWIVDQGNNPHETVRRMARRLKQLEGQDAMADTVQMIRGVCGRDGRDLSHNAKEAIETVERVMKFV